LYEAIDESFTVADIDDYRVFWMIGNLKIEDNSNEGYGKKISSCAGARGEAENYIEIR
jgi:hypothetical protein